MHRADSLLNAFIKEHGIQEGIKLSEIKKKWNNLFAKPLSYHMSPIILSEGELLINVDSHIWLQELNFYKDDIKEKLVNYGVKSVRLRLGRVFKNVEPDLLKVNKEKDRCLSYKELSFIEETISLISDNELKDKIRKAMGKAIATRKI